MKHVTLRGAGLALCLVLVGAVATAGASEIDIPYTKFQLDNGLTVIHHQDSKAPIVAVNVWYHVGSKNEKRGRTGFAHLFEHLMFNGSENYNDDYFKPFDRVGATDMNGTTNFDRTNYFQNVPSNAVDVALWMESDRMGHLLEAIDQDKLDEQRGVVQNEKRQGENQPYGKVFINLLEQAFPEGHPYSWSTIGSMEDLEAASLDDVHEWFKQYYGPNNAVIVIAGDIDLDTAKAKAATYFGDIPPGPPLITPEVSVPKRTGIKRLALQDRVPQARVYMHWNVPEWGSAERDHLGLALDVLTDGKTSRLYKRLVYDDQIATDVGGFVWSGELASQFVMLATAQPGQDTVAVERAMKQELERFLREGPTANELQRVKTDYRAGFIRGIERIGGFGGKSDILAQNQVYGGSPDFYKTTLKRIMLTTREDVQQAARAWLSDGVLIATVSPFPSGLRAAAEGADRSALPDPGEMPKPKFPAMQKAELPNGLDVVLATRSAVPVVNFNLMLDAGYAADQGGIPGTASLAMNMLDEGTKNRTSLEISEQLDMLGARLGAGSGLDTSTVTLSALKENLDDSLAIYADVILNPSFPKADFGRLQKQQLAGIQREKTTPVQMALRVFPKLMYGADHAYGLPFTGSGTEASVASITPATLQGFHRTWFKPNNATLIVVGDITMAELKPKLEALFRGWKRGDVPSKAVREVEHRASSTVYLIDRPDSEQSVIFAGHIAPPKSNPDEPAIETMNEVLGGSFSARINMNLREDKHWSYGARSLIVDARGQRPFIVFAPVQTDKTKESMVEIQRELTDITASRPPSDDELGRAKDVKTLSLPGAWETNQAVMGSIAEMVRFGLADGYWDRYPNAIRELNLKQVTQIAKQTVKPNNVIWVVVGDREKIESGIRELGLGTIELLDPDGNPIAGKASAQLN